MSTSGTGASNNLFDLYVNDVIGLARTMVIKFEQVAEATNNLVIQKGGQAEVDQNNRRTWKYYQNISGVYNSTDTPMYVQSLDGNGEILFSKQALSTNPGTKAAYVYGSYYYRELVAKYPDQQLLILGVIYPCDIDEAIAAEDGTILAYPSFLVEEHETEFIPKLQTWIYNYVSRWVVKAYAITDDLYVASYVAQLTMNLIPAIMNIRLAACKTNQAHSFHISQYLRSHGFLDFYLAELTREQTLTFYRNIKYYVRNSGFKDTFEQLIEVLMTKRDLPVYEYVFTQNSSSIAYTDPDILTDLYPTALFERRPLNAAATRQPLSSHTVSDVLGVISKAAPSNDLWRKGHEERIVNQFKDAPTSVLKTKIIEVGLPRSAVNAARTPSYVYQQQWMALAASGAYDSWITITPPGTDVPLQLTQPKALALWIYALYRSAALPTSSPDYVALTRVPMITLDQVATRNLPTKADLRKAISSVVSTSAFDEMYSYAVQAPALIQSQADFKTFCGELYAFDLAQYRLYSSQEDARARGQLELVSSRIHESYKTSIVGLTETVGQNQVGITYVDFFNQIGFNPSTYSAVEFYELATTLFKNATGFDLDSVDNPLNIQRAMVALLQQLSSYSILVVTNTELSDERNAGMQAVRLSNYAGQMRELSYVETAPIAMASKGRAVTSELTVVDVTLHLPEDFANTSVASAAEVELPNIHTHPYGSAVSWKRMVETGILIKTDADPYASFNALTIEQKRALVAG
jgi:hypothetical protein